MLQTRPASLALAALALEPALACAAATSGSKYDNYDITGADIANVALQLECLEAQYYSHAAYGHGLSDELRGGGPAPIGGQAAKLTKLGKVCSGAPDPLRLGAMRHRRK
jgi:hypothetical protein